MDQFLEQQLALFSQKYSAVATPTVQPPEQPTANQPVQPAQAQGRPVKYPRLKFPVIQLKCTAPQKPAQPAQAKKQPAPPAPPPRSQTAAQPSEESSYEEEESEEESEDDKPAYSINLRNPIFSQAIYRRK